MKVKISSLFLYIFLISIFTFGCGSPKDNSSEQSGETRKITDAVGRNVEIPKEVKSVIPLANGLRMMCYADAVDLVSGVEKAETQKNIVRAYNWVNHDRLKELPIIGEGGGGGYTPYIEEILEVDPDVIIGAYSKKDAENLQEKTGIPVVVINAGTLFGEDYYQSLKIIGEVCQKEKRCQEVIDYIKNVEKDLNKRTENIPQKEKKVVYSGAVSFRGGHGIEGTYTNFPPFKALNAVDIFGNKEGETKDVLIEKEAILNADPDIIFLDPNNISLVNKDYASNEDYYQSLTAVKNGQVYTMLGYNYYYTNVEIALADCYYAGSIIYPKEFADIDPVKKANEIFKFMLGSEQYYQELSDKGLGFGEITLGAANET
ncbi:iron ABC transporter substrate-binding protein [Anaerosacchariphilus polymeriproducens]|uniref:Iron ABC transporter substrate-binding protein n=1 Tax=Anaerosacchariphilus polymeriproducens TaxID=1812858 RepID=A0A371AZT8_9FIRM|nr:iron ABC transporter substrate-binding protein [Anaerosacchariphilus polymeriproducens]RDU25118.1 iron ABC transporter substrate-binding protein [Anaerosacchariphilus polymeriproducens]